MVKALDWVTASKVRIGSIGYLAPNHDIIYYGQENVPTALLQVVDIR